MSPASYLTAPPRVAACSIALLETSKNVKARARTASYVGRNPFVGRSGDALQGEDDDARNGGPGSAFGGDRGRRERRGWDVRRAGCPRAAAVRVERPRAGRL